MGIIRELKLRRTADLIQSEGYRNSHPSNDQGNARLVSTRSGRIQSAKNRRAPSARTENDLEATSSRRRESRRCVIVSKAVSIRADFLRFDRVIVGMALPRRIVLARAAIDTQVVSLAWGRAWNKCITVPDILQFEISGAPVGD